MGENAFIAFALTAMGLSWQQCLGAVFISGIVFLIITVAGLRAWLAHSISPSMRYSFAVGIGLFLAFIGLYETGIVARGTGVPVKLGNLRDPQVLLAMFGFVLTVALIHRRVPGAILIGIVATASLGWFCGRAEPPKGVVALPFVGDYALGPVAFQLDIASLLKLSFLPIFLTLFLMGFLDTLGTLLGVGAAGHMLDEEGNFPQIERPMTVDALSCCFAGLIGTTTSGAYIESATGIREGARTGLAAIATAVLFVLALFFIPLLEPLQKLQYAYGPALIAVGVLMIGAIQKIDFADYTELIPAFATVTMMVFTYNIANGLTAGLLLYPVFKLLAGRWRELNWGSVVLAALCAVYYLFGLPH
jgi:AGZA family xanthine/uracil permease-like MFS transporter